MEEDRPTSDDPQEELAEVVPLESDGDSSADGGSFALPELDAAADDLLAKAETEASVEDDEDDGTFNTTHYDELAEAVRAADQAGPVDQNVSVHVAGLGAGIAGFSDIEEGAGVKTKDPGESRDETTEQLLDELEAEEADRTALRLRIATGLALVGIVGLTVWLGPVWFTALVGIIAVLGVGEFYSSARRVGFQPVAIVGLLVVIGTFIAGYTRGAYGIAGVVVAGVLALLLLYAVTPRRDPLRNAAVTTLGFSWVALLAFVAPISRGEGWQQLVVLIVFTVAATDTGAYFVGRTMGRTPLAPVLSPKKTVEGLGGGVILSFAVALAMTQIPWLNEVVTVTVALATAAVASLFGPVGDLGASAIKRSIGIKDMGTILPGHGGILDRIDSFLMSLPALYAVFLWLELLP